MKAVLVFGIHGTLGVLCAVLDALLRLVNLSYDCVLYLLHGFFGRPPRTLRDFLCSSSLY